MQLQFRQENRNVIFIFKEGSARFQVKRLAEFSSLDFKVQTEAIFAATNNAEFVIRTATDGTDITAFVESRLEVTRMANPERVVFISDLQRMAVMDDSQSPTVETVSWEEADSLRAEFSLLPTSSLFASSAEKYRTEDSDEDIKSGEGFVEDDSIDSLFDIP